MSNPRRIKQLEFPGFHAETLAALRRSHSRALLAVPAICAQADSEQSVAVISRLSDLHGIDMVTACSILNLAKTQKRDLTRLRHEQHRAAKHMGETPPLPAAVTTEDITRAVEMILCARHAATMATLGEDYCDNLADDLDDDPESRPGSRR